MQFAQHLLKVIDFTPELAKLFKLEVSRSVLVDLLDDLLEGGGLDAQPHHGQDGPDGVHVDRALLAEAVEALLQHCMHVWSVTTTK